jgi:N-acetylmuramoyl-L-alanine amidase
MVMNDKNDYSYKLAQSIQEHIGKSIIDNKEKFVDRKVKSAVAQVLLGAQMPSVLVEVGFLSHEKESQLLNTPRYQKVVAQGIFEGIMAIISL